MTPKYDNWEFLYNNIDDVHKFLSGQEGGLWGSNQGPDNAGRQFYYNYVKQLPEKAVILELGFGQGLDFSTLRELGTLDNKTYIGLDVTEVFVKHANKKLNWNLAQHYNGERIPYRDNYFDYTYTRHLWEHQPHYETLMKEVFRVTSKECLFNWFLPPLDNPEDEIHFEDKCFFHNRYSAPKLLQFIKEHGWDIHQEVSFIEGTNTDHIMTLRRIS